MDGSEQFDQDGYVRENCPEDRNERFGKRSAKTFGLDSIGQTSSLEIIVRKGSARRACQERLGHNSLHRTDWHERIRQRGLAKKDWLDRIG